MLLSVLLMLGLISTLIIAHELGHFWVAKRCGVKVERFGFGLPFGPTLWRKQFGETEYCLHLLLFGGYVAFPDDNPDSAIAKDSRLRFENQSAFNRFAIAVAGVTVNALLGWLIMIGVFLGWGKPVPINQDAIVGQILSADAPAAQAGLHVGDKILAVNSLRLVTIEPEKRLKALSSTIQQFPLQPVQLTVIRKVQNTPAADASNVGLKSLKADVLTLKPNAQGKIGVQLVLGETTMVPVHDVLEASDLSARFLGHFVVMNFEALGKMFTGQLAARELSGPIGIVNVGAQMIQQNGIQDGLRLTAIISVILAVMNLLPIPALDGGHILFIAIELLKGSPVKKELQERFVQVGFAGLLALMAFVLLNDINNTWIHPVQVPK